MARKVGMDEAARRFEAINLRDGIICCFDADSVCSKNYLESVHRHFCMAEPTPHGGAVYFEHLLPDAPGHRDGIIQYELHLRYYVHALRMIDYPYAHQTVGSSMIVRSDIYQKVGGMNKRPAGEDFYFLHRVMPSGNFIDIKDCIIYPSARISNRVPFGTGKAMEKWQNDVPDDYLTYSLESFTSLKVLFDQAEAFYDTASDEVRKLVNNMPASVKAFLNRDDFSKAIIRINKQSNNLTTFMNKWYQYFDGFKVLKFLHFARDHYYANSPVSIEAAKLVKNLWPLDTTYNSATDLLKYYRRKDQKN